MSDYVNDFQFNIENDELFFERANALQLIIDTFRENLSKSDEEIEEYSPTLHGDLKIINLELVETDKNSKDDTIK